MKILAFDFNNILEDVIKELMHRGHEMINHKDDWKKADVIVMWHETEIGGTKDWVREMQKAGKRVVLLQHGRRGTSRIFPPFNEELISDDLCAWGEADRERMISCGVPPEKIHVTGTPVLRHTKERLPHDGINVVFSPEHWGQEVPENLIVASTLRKMKGVNIITKILEGEHNPNEYPNPVSSNRSEWGHLQVCIETLQKADAVVAISESTFELLAQIMDIPVIVADIWIPKSMNGDDRYKTYKREYSDACERVQDMKKLEKVIKKHVDKPELLRAERAKIGIADGGMDIEDPVEELIKVICKE